jgi:hypothetical protein
MVQNLELHPHDDRVERQKTCKATVADDVLEKVRDDQTIAI